MRFAPGRARIPGRAVKEPKLTFTHLLGDRNDHTLRA